MGLFSCFTNGNFSEELHNSVLALISLKTVEKPLREELDDNSFYLTGKPDRDYFINSRCVAAIDGFCFFTDDAHGKPDKSARELTRRFRTDGTSCLSRIGGSFAFMIYDRQTRQFTLGRDSAGSRPLYYTRSSDDFSCSSVLNTLFICENLSRELSPIALSHYLSLLSVPDPDTIYKNVFQVKPGTTVQVSAGEQPCESRYFLFPDTDEERKSEKEAISDLRDTIISAVLEYERRMDTSLSLLSGGFDTTTITGILSRFGERKLTTLTIGYGTGKFESFNEFHHAREIAHHFDTDHHEVTISGEQFKEHLLKFVWHLEQPSGDAVNNYLAFLATSTVGSSVLTGFGGDEVFVGSLWFTQWLRIRKYAKLWHTIPSRIRSMIVNQTAGTQFGKKVHKLDYLAGSVLNQYIHLRFLFSEKEKENLFHTSLIDQLRETVSSTELSRELYQLSSELPDLERLISLLYYHEVTDIQLRDLCMMARAFKADPFSPLVDQTVLKSLCRLPVESRMKNNELRYPMRQALHDILPETTLNRKKKSFIVPMVYWLRDELQPVIHNLLSPENVRKRGHFNPDQVRNLTTAFFQHNRDDYVFKIWQLALLELWERVHMDNSFSSPPDEPVESLL